jgi:hypothetical protein
MVDRDEAATQFLTGYVIQYLAYGLAQGSDACATRMRSRNAV